MLEIQSAKRDVDRDTRRGLHENHAMLQRECPCVRDARGEVAKDQIDCRGFGTQRGEQRAVHIDR